MLGSTFSYRPEIDGLRAVAVIAVVVFHAFPALLPGGFTGVDVFFVISGYLISGLIMVALERGTFSFADFYSRRVRRIFPALSLVLSVSLLVGWLVLTPIEWRSLNKHVLAGAGFASNIALSKEAGYFDAAQHTKPLLHLWSLGIEEQFYILWPLILVHLWRRSSRVGLIISLAAIASFAWNLNFAWKTPTSNFYSLPARGWELLVGALLARIAYSQIGYVRLAWLFEAIGAIGASMVIASFWFLSDRAVYPGWLGLLPVIGTALVMFAGQRSVINRIVLSSRPTVWVGQISYPLYLWHWPLLVYFGLANESNSIVSADHAYLARIGIVLAAVLLAWVTQRFWERPMRNSDRMSTTARVSILVGAMFGVAFMSLAASRFVAPRIDTPVEQMLSEAASDKPVLPSDSIYYDINFDTAGYHAYELVSRTNRATLYAGDSHMEHYVSRAEALIRENPDRPRAVFALTGGCPPLPGLEPDLLRRRCSDLYRYWSHLALEKRFTTVVVSAFWEYYTIGVIEYPGNSVPLFAGGQKVTERDFEIAWNGLEHTLSSLVAAGKHVFIIGPSPASDTFNPKQFHNRLYPRMTTPLRPFSRKALEKYLAPVVARLQEVALKSGAQIINPFDTLCDKEVCFAVDHTGSPIYTDGHHLRASKAARLATYLDQTLRP